MFLLPLQQQQEYKKNKKQKQKQETIKLNNIAIYIYTDLEEYYYNIFLLLFENIQIDVVCKAF